MAGGCAWHGGMHGRGVHCKEGLCGRGYMWQGGGMYGRGHA